MEPTKQRIEKEAAEYASEIYSRDFNRLHWQNRRNGYVAGYERAQQELQAYRDKLKNAIREDFRMRLQKSAGLRQVMPLDDIIKLIDTVTPT